MMATSSYSFSLLLALTLALVKSTIQTGCTFPKYLQSTQSGVWLYRVRNQGAFSTQHHLIEVTFSGGKMVADVKFKFDAKDVEDPYIGECLNSSSYDKYIVSHTPVGKPTAFMCMEFYRQSNAVVFLRLSPIQEAIQNVSCKGLYTENWPLVKKNHDKGQIVPVAFDSFVGGYDINPVGDVRLKWLEQCDTTSIPSPRMEVACLPRDVINIHFHQTLCIPPDLMMTKVQKLLILGVWEEYDYVFMVFKADKRPNYWCARFQKSNVLENQVDMVIFLDLVCDPTSTFTEGKNRMEFELMKSLASISNTSPQSARGRLETSYQGHWVHMDGESMVNFTQSTVYHPEQGLYELSADGKVITGGLIRVPLYSTTHAGCTPKAICMELGLHSVNVMRYKMSSTTELEKGRTYQDPQSEFCRSDLFTEDSYTLLIRMNQQEDVACNLFKLQPWFQYHTVDADRNQCEGDVKVPCFRDNVIEISHNTCPNYPKYTNNHVCLASFSEKRGGRVVITRHEPPEEARLFSCWIFKQSQNLMFYAHAQDCDENTAFNYELYEEGKEYLTLFSIKEVNHTCVPPAEPETTALAEPTEEPEPELEIYTVAEIIADSDTVGGAPICTVSLFVLGAILLAHLI